MQNLFPLTVLSLNCQQAYYRNNIKQFLFDTLERGNVQFLMLQEVSAPILEILGEACGTGYKLALADFTPSSIAIVYRKNFELLDHSKVRFP